MLFVLLFLVVCTFSVEILLGIRHDNHAQILNELLDVSTYGNAKYGQHLSLEEVKALTAVDKKKVSGILEWLNSLNISKMNVQSDFIRFEHSEVPEIPAFLANKIDYIVPYLRSNVWDETIPNANLHHFEFKDSPISSPLSDFIGSPDNMRKAYGVPDSQKGTNHNNLQMVWGPGTFGYSPSDLEGYYRQFCQECRTSDVSFDTKNHGESGGDNWGEGSLDTDLISAMGVGVKTLVSNTNTSTITEETIGFGYALLNFVTELNTRDTVPNVLSMSLGSLSFFSCDFMCSHVTGSYEKCWAYMMQQRQVCMYPSADVESRINVEFQKLGLRGVTLLAATGDGGSHFSFQPFSNISPMGRQLNEVSCKYNFPTFPAASPFVLGVGGTSWSPDDDASMNRPVGWNRGGAGFAWAYDAMEHQQLAIADYLNNTHGLPSDGAFNAGGRGYPDISTVAWQNIPFYLYGEESQGAGTSASAPIMAGIMSQINDVRLNNGLNSMGWVNPRLYQFADNTVYRAQMFRDITSGKSAFDCDEGFPATKGWDAMTGWGEPNFAGLSKYLGTDDFEL